MFSLKRCSSIKNIWKPKNNLQDSTQKHFVAFYKGVPYSVRIFDDSGSLLEPEDIHASLAWILQNGKEAKPEESVG